MYSSGILRFTILLIIVSIFSGCSDNSKPSGNRISGKIEKLPGSYIVLSEILPDKTIKIDSLKTENGEFEFGIDIDDSKILNIGFANNQNITAIVSPGENIKINSEFPEIVSNYIISGSMESILLKQYSDYSLLNLFRIDSLRQIFEAYKDDENFARIRDELGKQYMDIYEDQKDYAREFIIANPGKLSSLIVLNRKFGQSRLFENETDMDLLIKIDSGLSVNYPNNLHTKKHRDLLIELQNYLSKKLMAEQYTAPGMPLPLFTLNDTEGKRISIEALKNKALLLYFWASWDGLSRQTNHFLKDLQKKNDELNILAVSFDQNPDLWKAAINIDELPFQHASDLKGTASPLFILLNLPDRLPYFILTEKGGIIKYRGSDPDDMQQAMQKISDR